MITVLFDILRLSGVYVLMGLGFVIIYRASRVLTLAQPGLIMMGAYAALRYLPQPDGGPTGSPAFWFICLALIAGGAVAGLVIYVLLIRPMAGNDRVAIVLMTVAALFMFEALIDIFWTGESGFLRIPGNREAYQILGSRVRLFELVPIIIAIALWAAVSAFYRWSKAGIRIRAVAENAALAARRGINIDRVGAISWALAASVAVISGLVVGTQGPVSTLIVATSLKGFTVALVGGLDSVAGLPLAAILVAGSEVLTVRYIDQQWGEAVPFALLLVVLMMKPWGLAGTKEELERV